MTGQSEETQVETRSITPNPMTNNTEITTENAQITKDKDWCSIQTDGNTTQHPPQLSVLSYSPPLPATYYKQIPNIQNLLLHLEGKSRSKNTIIAYAKALKALALRADLNNTKKVMFQKLEL